MKSLTLLWQKVAQDMSDLCGTSTTNDYRTVVRRVEAEGLSFLTITLPNFAKDLQKGLERGYVAHDLFTGFRFRGGLPCFLGGFLEHIFDRRSGWILQDPSSDCVLAVRQLTLLYGKMELACTDARRTNAIKEYLNCEQEVKEYDSRFFSDPNSQELDILEDFHRVSLLLFGDVLSALDFDIHNGDIVPKHGPGSTADKLTGNQKLTQTEWPDRLEEEFAYIEYALPSLRYHQMVDRVTFLTPEQERPVRVITVPKTLKTPRIIAIEPTAMQYMQQAIMECLCEYLETDILQNRTSAIRGMIGFRSQEPNQFLALKGSQEGILATLDLSEASDRVSNQLVQLLLDRYPHVNRGVQACRSRKADVDGQVIRLSKFASMGSALTFPIEAMVFLTAVFVGIQRQIQKPLSRAIIKSFRDEVRIFGDDIIVPVDYVQSVIGALEDFGLRVNTSKSFWNGRFRESCGKDYFAGDDVSVIRCRELLPTSRKDVSEIVSTVSLRNHMFMSGNWRTARHLDGLLTDILRHFPAVLPTSPALGRISSLGYDSQKEDKRLHKPMVKAYVVSATIPENGVDGADALLKWFLKRGTEPFAALDHLERSGRPEALHINSGWYSAV